MKPADTADAWLPSLLNILKLEQERGFDNEVVHGGLDGFIQNFADDIKDFTGNAHMAARLISATYGDLEPRHRARWVEEWWKLLSADGDAADEEAAPSPKAGRAAAAKASGRKPRGAKASSSGNSARSTEQTAAPDVDQPVDRLRGVDTRTAARLKRLDVFTIRDLLYLFPRRHTDYSQSTRIADLVVGMDCTVVADVWESRTVSRGPQGKRKDTEVVLSDESGNLRVVWFGQGFVAQALKPGARVAISGKTSVFQGHLVFQSPEYELLDSGRASIHTGRLVPVYPLTDGLTARRLRGFAWQAVQEWLGGVEELLPRETLDSAGMMPLQRAIAQAHYPDDEESWAQARRRLAFDELVTLQLAVLSRKQQQDADAGGVAIQAEAPVLRRFLESLPFELTAAQKRCIGEIRKDLERGTPAMNRLLQGEVGSGKTVVALTALLMAAAAGHQGALMAPTEVLAEQHFQTAKRLLGGVARPVIEENRICAYLDPLPQPVSVGLITGSVKPSRKRELTRMAADGSLDILIGTQALIQEGVTIPRLALAVSDEQHRFGVLQRSALRQKSEETPHALLMSATPIPRTLSLTLYGDLDVSTLDQLPAGRQEIATRWLPPTSREAAYGFVRKQVQEGRQGFVICPLVDESDVVETKAATEEYRRLSEEIFPDLRLGLLHGRMRSKEKDRVMREFRDGELDLLVSTPVVEVGIDVANATVMMIEGADRFGLAQLHQFRGRVGRGEHKSYCILLSDSPSAAAQERLSALENIRDGFKLAEADLELRGPGDFFGTRQSGMPALRMAQLSDRQMLETAREEAGRIIANDPDLSKPEHQPLAAQVARFMELVTAEDS